jgi:hypothetical protein
VSLQNWMSAAQDDCVRNFVAFVADADEVEIALARRAELSWIRLAGVGADRLTHAEEDRAGAAIGLVDDNRGVAVAGTGDAEFALSRGLALVLGAGDLAGRIHSISP